ncbi:MAG: ABC transporter ATP-binding protein [Pseudomonadota bacterium]
MENLLEVKNLKTYFHTKDGVVKAVDDVSFYLKKGETLGIVGESGSGKSVCNLSILKLLKMPPAKIESGEILFNGVDLAKMSEKELRKIRGNDISFIFQDPMTSLNPFLTIETQVTEGIKLHKQLSSKEALEKALGYLELVGIPDPASRIKSYPHQFSGGMRQRVMIAMALITEPSLIIADEPTTALDVTIQAQILKLMNRIKEKINTSIIFITHDLGVVASMADRIAVMYAGKIVETGTCDEIFNEAQHPYTKGLLKSVPRIDKAEKERLSSIEGMPPSLLGMKNNCPFQPRCERSIEDCTLSFPDIKELNKTHQYFCHNA